MEVAAPDRDFTVNTVPTKPIEGQKPGTSGLRKKTKVFKDGAYLQNFVQSVFNTLVDMNVPVKDGVLVISGDGRFWNPEAIQIIIKMAFANGVGRVWCGKDGLLSTPAVSAVIRTRGKGFVPFGGFICSASHNPGGEDEDFGIKYNTENGGPAPEKMTDKMVEWTAKIEEYKICDNLGDIDLSKAVVHNLGGGKFLDVFDSVEDHNGLLKKCFDYNAIRQLFRRDDFKLTYDCMSGVQGPYAIGILEKELGAERGTCKNAEPKPDFGGPDSAWHGHADPNLCVAVELVAEMGLDKEGNKVDTGKPIPNFGAAADGDADRNMILGSQFFVSPSDSLAMIVANSHLISQFKYEPVKACARSMPTSGAVDLVAKEMKIDCFEVPTGWKFFGNLMDSGTPYYPDKPSYTPFVCGEESFGTGSDHVREKDGMWATLAWLQILAAKTKESESTADGACLYSVEMVANEHWKKYGRNYYARYDYEGVDKDKAEEMMKMMAEKASVPKRKGTLSDKAALDQPSTDSADSEEASLLKQKEKEYESVSSLVGQEFDGYKMKSHDIFEYEDPVDGSISQNQGIMFIFEDNHRIIFRLSGTGVAGATIRLYLEKYVDPRGNLNQHQFEVVKPLAKIALELSDLEKYTGRDKPTVIT